MKPSITPIILLALLSAEPAFLAAEERNNDEGSPTVNTPSDSKSELNSPSDDCTCVKYFLCNDTRKNNEEIEGLIDIVGHGRGRACPHFLQRCCEKDKILPENKPFLPKPKPETTSSCGNRFLEGIDIRVDIFDYYEEAGYGEFPWMVALIQFDPTPSQPGKVIYLCGGSLIHPQVVLTAVHCVKGKENIVIRAGEWDTETDNEIYPTQDRKVLEVIMQEQFNNRSLHNDLALLILESPVNMTLDNVGLICLPEQNETMDGRLCVANGWGKELYGKVVLKRAYLSIMSHDSCLQDLRKTRLKPNFNLHESFICTGGQKDGNNCKADGGAALACPHRNDSRVYVQAGIVAWGLGCGMGTPLVHVNVPYFVKWIQEKMQERNLF